MPIIDLINTCWIQRSMERFNIVTRRQCQKLMISPANQLLIEKEVVFHLGKVRGDFQGGLLHEDLVENIDETHFVINADNGRTMGCSGAQKLMYANVVSRDRA